MNDKSCHICSMRLTGGVVECVKYGTLSMNYVKHLGGGEDVSHFSNARYTFASKTAIFETEGEGYQLWLRFA